MSLIPVFIALLWCLLTQCAALTGNYRPAKHLNLLAVLTHNVCFSGDLTLRRTRKFVLPPTYFVVFRNAILPPLYGL